MIRLEIFGLNSGQSYVALFRFYDSDVSASTVRVHTVPPLTHRLRAWSAVCYLTWRVESLKRTRMLIMR